MVIHASGLSLAYRDRVVVEDFDLALETGRVLGLIGRNGAGKTSLIDALLGFMPHQGALSVLGHDPWRRRDAVMRQTAFVSDVAVLPRWLTVANAIDYVAGVQPRFDRAKAETLLARTTIERKTKVRHLSKGMVTQLHLALAMATDCRLLVLDEPTLGLDLVYRKAFYDALLGDFCDDARSVVVATHQVEEIEHVLTDFVFLAGGRTVLAASMADYESRFIELSTGPDEASAARALNPISERSMLGRSVFLFDGAEREALDRLGQTRTPGLADLFLAVAGREDAS